MSGFDRSIIGWRRLYWPTAAALLAAPAMAMPFTREVNWGPEDFLVMGLLLVLVGFAADGVLHLGKTLAGRVAGLAAVVLAFLLIWAQLAVGIV